MTEISTQERFKRGAADAGQFFNYIAEFVGFSDEDAATIRETRFVVEKYIPSIVAGFYSQLLRFPSTRKLFQKKDGTIDMDYLQLRMQHQANFWRRAAAGKYDEDFARFVDYVSRAHTSKGADPKIYVPERYVIGMVSFVQQRILEALEAEYNEIDHAFALRATKSWNAFLMVILELLARSYGQERQEEVFSIKKEIDDEAMYQFSVETYERALGIARQFVEKEIFVALPDEIQEGQRKIIEVDGFSIGVFHHQGQWVALQNSCLHRGGPVCTGKLEGDTLTCPWHGYQYDVRNGRLLLDPSAQLPGYPVEVRADGIYLKIETLVRDELDISFDGFDLSAEPAAPALAENEFLLSQIKPGEAIQIQVSGKPVAIYNVNGKFYATHGLCTHMGGPLSQGRLDGLNIICPWHDSCFDVTTGEVVCGPAKKPVRTYRVVVEGNRGIVVDSGAGAQE